MVSYLHDRGNGRVDGWPRTLSENKIKDEEAITYNKKVEQRELDNWKEIPISWCWYVTDTEITTFLGTKVGEIIKRNTYKNNLGVNITSIAMRGTNGYRYYGRYGNDTTQLCRFRIEKSK